MKKNLTELVMILDRSGSMAGLEADTIGGYNAMLGRQRELDGEVIVSTVLFDDHIDVIHDRLPIDRVPQITEKEYYVRGCTALLDAVGGAVHHIANVHKYAREEDRPEKTIFVITTDGMENASRQYSYEKVRRMVEKEKRNMAGNSSSLAQIWTPSKWRAASGSARTVQLPMRPTMKVRS